MASATVLLKEGKSYSFPDGPNMIKFEAGIAKQVAGRELIDKLKTISCLAVEEHTDKPVTPLKAVAGKSAKPVAPKAAPQPEPEPEEEQDQGEAEQTGDAGEETDGDPEMVEADGEPEPEADPEPEPAKPAAAKSKPGAKGGKKV